MQTGFTLAQLADEAIAQSNDILRKCVHCGFCLATCPTYVVLGDERDSPRGRIYLIKDMLESGAATAASVEHIDRCLTCLSCMTTCPSSVDYMHLIDHARQHIARTHRRPLFGQILRRILNAILPYTERFKLALATGRLASPLGALLPKPLRTLLALAGASSKTPTRNVGPTVQPDPLPSGGYAPKMRVVLLKGCVQSVLRPEINEAAKRLLTRAGITVLDVKGESCCGALSHHLGEEGSALRFAKANIDAWTKEVEAGLDAVVITASGCGTMIKDYGYLLRSDPAHAAKAAHISGLAKDVSELLAEVGLPPVTRERSLAVAYHSACSLQHGQRINKQPRDLLRAAGFDISEIGEGHLCCGSAGIYSVLEPGIADELLARKAANIERTAAAVVATGNIGCITQLARRSALPVVHTVELLDWATGGPAPPELTAASAAPA